MVENDHKTSFHSELFDITLLLPCTGLYGTIQSNDTVCMIKHLHISVSKHDTLDGIVTKRKSHDHYRMYTIKNGVLGPCQSQNNFWSYRKSFQTFFYHIFNIEKNRSRSRNTCLTLYSHSIIN